MQSAAKFNQNPTPNPKLGEGSYGTVYERVDPKTGEVIAIKKAEALSFSNKRHKKRLLREIKLLRIFQGHPNIIPLIGLETSAISPATLNNVDVIFKKFDTDLFKVINTRQNITQEHVQFFLYQILCGINFLHSAHVVHRDLKPANILLNSNCDLAICDFGLARALKPLDSYVPKLNFLTSQPGVVSQAGSSASKQSEKPKFTRPLTPHVVTRWYRAPEIILDDDSYGLPVDMWSIGCILSDLLRMQYNLKPRALFPGITAFPHSAGDNPEAYLNKDDQLSVIFDIIGTPSKEDIKYLSNERARRYLESLPYKPPKSFSKMFPQASPAAIDLLNRLLTFNPTKRITAHDALRHEFLKPRVDDTMNLTFPLPPSLLPSPLTISEIERSLFEYYQAEIEINDRCGGEESIIQHNRLHHLILEEVQKYHKVSPLQLKQLNPVSSSSTTASSTAIISSALSAVPSGNASAITSVQSSIEPSQVSTKPSDVTSNQANKVTHDKPLNPSAAVLEHGDELMTDAELHQSLEDSNDAITPGSVHFHFLPISP